MKIEYLGFLPFITLLVLTQVQFLRTQDQDFKAFLALFLIPAYLIIAVVGLVWALSA